MERQRCEVVGCRQIAVWRRSHSPADSVLEEYLCDRHFDELYRRHREVADLYVSLEPRPLPDEAEP